MDIPVFAPRPIPPIIHRHAQDAAWYWAQARSDRISPLVDFERQFHFHSLLEAHLDGLRSAGEFGRETALANFIKWKGAEEAFVCWLLALESGESALVEQMWEACAGQEKYNSATASALAFMDAASARPYLDLWLSRSSELPQAAAIALNALGLRRESAPGDMASFFRHEHVCLRAEACRYAGRLRLREYLPLLAGAARDKNAQVRERAGVALLLCGEKGAALPLLREAALRHYDLALQEKGLDGILAGARCAYLSTLLGHSLPLARDAAENEGLLKSLPARPRLVAMANHGDARHVPELLGLMAEDNNLPRQAFWAMCFILGLNADEAAASGPQQDGPQQEGLQQDGPPDPQERIWPDAGLPWPDVERAEKWWAKNSAAFGSGGLWLGGRPAHDAQNLLMLARCGSQAQRMAASLRLAHLLPGAPWLDNCAPMRLQFGLMEKIGHFVREMP